MAVSYTDLTVEEKNALNQRVTASGYVGNQGIIKLNMFVSNLQVQKIQTFPKNDLEFIAEVPIPTYLRIKNRCRGNIRRLK